MRYFLGLVLSLLSLTACNTIEIERVRTEDKHAKGGYLFVSDQLAACFTPEAQTAIQDIKIYEGLHINSYVVGVNFWSDFVSFLIFNGIGRKIITSQGTLSSCPTLTIVHEYVHHLDDMDRDGEIKIIDHLEFWKAFLEMRSDPSLLGACNDIMERSDHFITNTFGIGPLSELIAYTAGWIVENPDLCPTSMHRVFSDILVVSRDRIALQK